MNVGVSVSVSVSVIVSVSVSVSVGVCRFARQLRPSPLLCSMLFCHEPFLSHDPPSLLSVQERKRTFARDHYSVQNSFLVICPLPFLNRRPDYCLGPHLRAMLSYGCTRLEIGVQSTYEDVARDTNRGHTVGAVVDCFRLAKDAGFKVRRGDAPPDCTVMCCTVR